MPLRRLLMLPHLVRWGIRAPRDAEGRWDRYWAGVRTTGDGGDVLWDSGDPDEPARYLDILERFADPDLPVLDLGCGNGRFTRALSRRGWRAIGVDVSDAAVALAHDESGSGAAGGERPPSFVVADLTDAGAMDRLAEELGEVNVLVRGVLHVLDPDARRELARNVGRFLGDRGVAVIAETNHQGSLLSYLESLGAGARGLPRPLARAIASGLPTPRPFGAEELDRSFPDDGWERLQVDDDAVIHAVPMHRSSAEPERIRGLVAVLRRRARVPEPRRSQEETGRVVPHPTPAE